MKKPELNEQIALFFGFEKSETHPVRVNFVTKETRPQWTFPRDWYLAQGGVPNVDIPDFVQILEDYLNLLKKHQHGGPREYFGRLDWSASKQDRA